VARNHGDRGSRRDGKSARKGRRQDPERPRPPRPDGWRDVLNPDYDYPEEMDTLGRRDRHKAKRDWRREDHAERMAWIRDQRRSEPASPAGLIAVVLLLALIVLGLGGGLRRLVSGDEAAGPAPVAGQTTNAGEPTDPTTEPGSTAGSEPAPSDTPSPPESLPTTTQRPGATSVTAANQVVASWARVFYTRTPALETYEDLVERAAQYTTDEVATSFTTAGDSTYDALAADGGRSRVVSAPVSAPRPGTAPVDTPTRITRVVTISIDVTGRRAGRLVVPLLVTVGLDRDRWVISDVTGGTGI
jgi:hypothetical protein